MAFDKFLNRGKVPEPAGAQTGRPPVETAGVFFGAVRLMLEGLQSHSLRGDEADYRQLHDDVQDLIDRLGRVVSEAGAQRLGADAVTLLEAYNLRLARHFETRDEERREIIIQLAGAVAAIAAASPQSLARLEEIASQIGGAALPDQLRQWRADLAECLGNIRDESLRQRNESAQLIAQLQKQAKESAELLRAWRTTAVRSEAGRRQQPEAREPERTEEPGKHAAVFVLHRTEWIAKRYGESVKHAVLARLGQELKQKFGASDRLLRWKGSSFLVFLEEPATREQVKAQLKAALPGPGEQYLEVSNRSVVVPFSVSWAVLRVSDFPSLEVLFERADAFADAEARAARSVHGFREI